MATTIDPAWRMPEAMWERGQDLLPVRKSRKTNPGRKPLEWRPVLDGILYVLRTGCHWQAAPPEFGSESSLHQYFQRLVESGFFAELWRRGLLEYEQLQGINWQWQNLDGSMTKAPLEQFFGGREKRGEKPDRPRQIRNQVVRLDRWLGRAERSGGGGGQHTRHADGRGHAGKRASRWTAATANEEAAPVR
jgi:transposase